MLVLAAVAPASSAPAPASWATVAPGAEHLHVDDGNIDLFRFDLTRFRADVAVPGAGGPMTAAELRRESGAALVVNGGFFDTDGRSLGLRIASGRQIIKLRAVVDWGSRHPDGARRHRALAQLRSRRRRRRAARDRRHPGRAAHPVDGKPPTLKPQAARRTAVALESSRGAS